MLVNIEDHRRRAKRRLPRFVFDFVEGGADDETCMRRNRADMERLALAPSCLRDGSRIDTSVEVFGWRWRAPISIAPTGFNGLLRPDGDLLMARAAAAAGVPFTLSTASNVRMERLRGESDGECWFQLYVMTDRSIAEQMMARALAAGFTTLVLTVDVPVSGNRERDRHNRFRVPFRPSLATILDLCRHPAWLADMALSGAPRFANLGTDGDRDAAELQAALLNRALDRSLTWDVVDWLRRCWDGPIVIKGLLSPDDAARAVQSGVDGIIVSNHGGRQLDAAPSTISALPSMIAAVAGRIPVFVDSGFRRGSDVVKALALGAKGVLLGRSVLYGLAAGGEAGVRAVLETLIAEIENIMTLIGAASIADIGPRHIVPNIPAFREGSPA